MDATNALLSCMVQTKSLERVLSPISSKISQLIIQNEAYSQGDMTAFPTDLTPSAMDVMRSAEKLVDAGSSILSTTTDQVLKHQMPQACESLSVSGQTLVTATQRLQIEEFSPEARNHLVTCAKHVLEATLKVLLVSDDAEVRRIVKAGNSVLERLAVLTAVKQMKDLVPVIKSITDSVLIFTKMADKRQVDLTHAGQKEAVITSLSGLKKCLPMLNSSMQTYVKFPNNVQAISGKEYAVGQVIESVNEVIAALENKLQVRTMDETEEPGQFVITVDKIITQLNGEVDLTSLDGQFDHIIESTIRHSMAVAHLSQEQQRIDIINNCHLVLKQRTQLFDLIKSLKVDQSLTETKAELIELCTALSSQVQILEENVASAVLHLVICVCKESTEPFERLVKAAMSLFTTELQNNVNTEEALKPYIDAFHIHSDTLCQVARFVAAACPEPKKRRSLCCCINQLEKLDPELVPSTLACRTKNSAAMEHLRLIKKEWAANVELIITNIDDVINKEMFVQYSEKLLKENVRQCKNTIYSEVDDIALITRSIFGQGRRFMLVAQKLANQSNNILHRNSVMLCLSQLKKVLKATKSAASRLLGDTGELRYHETLHSRCDQVMAWVTRVNEAFKGGNHQDADKQFLELKLEEDSADVDDKQLYNPVLSSHLTYDSVTASKHTGKREETALMEYVAELKHDRIQELSRSFVSSSIAGEKDKVSLYTNDLLKWTNHVCDVATALVICTVDEAHKKILVDLGSSLKCTVSDILDMSKRVIECYIENIEDLHKLADIWTNEMSYLIMYIDGVTDKWKVVSDRVVDAAKLCNVQLVSNQMLKVYSHQKFVLEIASSTRSLLESEDHCWLEQSLTLQDSCLELENLTVLLATQADSLAKSDSSYEKEHIEITSREWASRIYVIIATVIAVGNQLLSERQNVNKDHLENVTYIKKIIGVLTEDTVRIKTLVESADKKLKDADGSLNEKVGLLDILLASINEQYEIMCIPVATTKELEKFYAPYNLTLLHWTWLKQVHNVFGVFDIIVGEFTTLPKLILTSTDNKESLSSVIKICQERLNKIKTTVNLVIQPSNALDQKQAVWQLLRELELILKQMCLLGESESDLKDLLKYELLCRSWGVKCKELLEKLHSMSRVNNSSLRETEKLLKGNPCHLDSGQSPVSVPHNVATGGQKEARNVPDNSISTSLLDFADNLGTTLFEFEDDDIKSSPVAKVRSTSNTSQSTKGTSHTYTPEVKPKSVPSPSWQELAKGPKMQHSTPLRPSEKSGFRSNKPKSQLVANSSWTVEAERWEDENNAIVRVAKETTYLVNNMASYLKGEGTIETRDDLIDVAKSVAVNGEKLVKFAKLLVDYSIDKRCATDLHSQCMTIPTVIAQLHIMSRVKEASPDDDNGAERMLLKTAQNLVSGINRMLNAAEAVCVKGLRQPPKQTLDETEAIILATQWKRRFNQHRQVESSTANRDALGLRKVNHINTAPALVQIMQQR